jgi:hypothetical protein
MDAFLDQSKNLGVRIRGLLSSFCGCFPQPFPERGYLVRSDKKINANTNRAAF